MNNIIKFLKKNTTKKEFKKHLFDLIFVEAKNDEEVKNNKYVQIPNSVTFIGMHAFKYWKRLTSINIPNSVTSIEEDAFAECRSLTSITIPNSVTSIKECTFGFCESLTSITIPNSVTSIGEAAFYYCTSLTSIDIPKKFEKELELIFLNLDLSNVKVTYT